MLPVRAVGQPAMLKVAHEAEERSGADLMVWWQGQRAAKVFAQDGDAILMERAMGTRSLTALAHSGSDGEASRVLCRAIAALHAHDPGSAPDVIPLPIWFEPLLVGHARYGGIATICAQTAAALLTEKREPVVLHGDIHHGNVLDFGERGWLAIDPKGLLGDRAFDYANIFRNPDIETAVDAKRFARRLDVICETATLERRRLVQWILAFAGLSSVWVRDDGDPAQDDLRIMDLAVAELARL